MAYVTHGLICLAVGDTVRTPDGQLGVIERHSMWRTRVRIGGHLVNYSWKELKLAADEEVTKIHPR